MINKKELLKDISTGIPYALLTFFIIVVLRSNSINIPNWVDLGITLVTGIVGILLNRYLFDKLKTLQDIENKFSNFSTKLETDFNNFSSQINLKFNDLSTNVNSRIEQYENKLQNAILSQDITKNYFKIIDGNFNKQVNQYISQIMSDPKNTFHSLANNIGKELAQKINQNNDWYIPLHNFLMEENTNLGERRFNLLLGTYLNAYGGFIKMYMNRAIEMNKRLVIYSFTNAIPEDWFSRDKKGPGNVLRDFAEDKRELIVEMKNNRFDMVMITLTNDNKKLADFGFRTYSEVKNGWFATSKGNREKYLDELHTERNKAQIANIMFENLLFEDNLTEFIYFGFVNNFNEYRIEEVNWQLCISGGYSSKNDFLLVKFNFFTDEKKINDNIISIENKESLMYDSVISPPKKLEIKLKDFPSFILNPKRNLGTVKIEEYDKLNVNSLEDNWKLVAKIWHTDKEESEIFNFLFAELKDKQKVLDVACGTGFHTKILCDLGKKVTASDISQKEIDELNKEPWAAQVITHVANWNSLSEIFKGGNFDGVICLGTSLPYYKSWEYDDKKIPLAFQLDDLKSVIKNFSLCLNELGTLIIGLSRYNEKPINAITIPFSQMIDGQNYQMNWNLKFNWKTRVRIWNTQIFNTQNHTLNFSVAGLLFDHNELKEICQEEFESVEIKDISYDHYDKYIVCRNKRNK